MATLESRGSAVAPGAGFGLLFVGDAGTTEATLPSERWGLELNNWMIDEVWSLEADIAWTDARFGDNAVEGRHIPEH